MRKVIILGHAGHGKSTLLKAIETVSNHQLKVNCIEADISKLKAELDCSLDKEIFEVKEHKPNRAERRGNKKVKEWNRNRFWQK